MDLGRLVKGQDSVHNGVIRWVVMNSPEHPVTYESARAWALDYAQSSESTAPIEDVRHADLEADHQAGGFAFVVPGHQLMIIGRDGIRRPADAPARPVAVARVAVHPSLSVVWTAHATLEPLPEGSLR